MSKALNIDMRDMIVMRILQVIPVFSAPFGGPVKVVRSISKELAKRHEVTVYTTTALDSMHDLRNSPFEVEIDGYHVVYFPRIFRFSGFNIAPSMIRVFKKTIGEYDVIHLHSWRHFQDMIVYRYAKKYNVPYVLQAHGSLPRIIAKQRLKWIYDMSFGFRLLKNASKVIALSQAEAQQYRNMGVPSEKIEIIPNGINLSEYALMPPRGSFRKKFGIEDDEKIVLYVGRIHESKGLDLLAYAFNIVSKDLSKIRLVVVGPDDGYVATFSKLIFDLEIEKKVLLTGFLRKMDKLAAFSDSDVFVTPRFYGFPVTFLESCLAGCPIVTTTDELDWIHNNIGYVVENSSLALARAISDILQNENLRRKFQNNCRLVIENFNISTVATYFENTYKSLAKMAVT